jgi:hypothetical protein
MAIPTDRGLVVIEDNGNGTKTVSICARVIDGMPRSTYARHFAAPRVTVAADVRLTVRGGRRFTEEIVEVVPDDDGALLIRHPALSHSAFWA